MTDKEYIKEFKKIGVGLFLFFLCSGGVDGQYKINKEKVWGWVSVGVAGFADGVVERWEFQGRKKFEEKWGVDEYGFWGSRSWEKLYSDPNIWNINMGVFDFYHVMDDVRKVGYIGGGVMIGIGGGRKEKLKYRLIDFGIGLVISGGMKMVGDRMMDKW